MKRKFILGLIAHAVLFLAACVYVGMKVRVTTAQIEEVVRLHQAELLREDYLIRVLAAQSSRQEGAPTPAAVPEAGRLRAAVGRCFGCHHSPEGMARLEALRDLTARYQLAVDSIAQGKGPRSAADTPEAIGAELARQLQEVIETTNSRLARFTISAMAEVARTNYVVFGLGLLGPALSALLWFVAGRRLTRSLDALVRATRKLMLGDLDHRVDGLRDEFAELSTSFNEMAASLKQQVHLMQRTEQLAVAGELAAGLVHEIKNPLAGIKTAVQVLAEESTVSDEDRDVLGKVAREVVGLESLLRAFLEFARPPRPHLADVNVNEFVESVLAFYMRSHIARPDRPIRIRKALGTVPPARADPVQLKQILLNLLLNAVDAMPDGGAVEVRTSTNGTVGELHIDIVDTGRGISPQYAGDVFRPFFTTKPGGTGLGLAVSKRLAEQQGGSIFFIPNPGPGTTFRIRLPSAAPA